jgi:hypothetical protein
MGKLSSHQVFGSLIYMYRSLGENNFHCHYLIVYDSIAVFRWLVVHYRCSSSVSSE